MEESNVNPSDVVKDPLDQNKEQEELGNLNFLGKTLQGETNSENIADEFAETSKVTSVDPSKLRTEEKIDDAEQDNKPQYNELSESQNIESKPEQKHIQNPQSAMATTLPVFKDRNQFVQFMNEPYYKKPKRHHTVQSVTITRNLSKSEITPMADSLMKGKSLRYDDPITVSSVVTELVTRKSTAMNDLDYGTCQHITEATQAARTTFRTRDRDHVHASAVGSYRDKLEEAKLELSETTKRWGRRQTSFDKECQQRIQRLLQEQQEEHEALEEYWSDPNNLVDFSRRSPALLNQMQQEKALFLTERYGEAEEMRNRNQQMEKHEIAQQSAQMQLAFENARARLIERQKNAVAVERQRQERERAALIREMKSDISSKQKRVDVCQKAFEEQDDLRRFTARAYHGTVAAVKPPTVLFSHESEDLPVSAKVAIAVVETKMRASARPTSLRMNLPALKIRKYRVPGAKKKDKDVI